MLQAKGGNQPRNLPWVCTKWFYSHRDPKPSFKRVLGEQCRRSGFAQLHFQLTSLIQNYLGGNTRGWYRNLWNFRKENPFCFQLKILSTDSRDKCRWSRTKKKRKNKVETFNYPTSKAGTWLTFNVKTTSLSKLLPILLLPITQHAWLFYKLHPFLYSLAQQNHCRLFMHKTRIILSFQINCYYINK